MEGTDLKQLEVGYLYYSLYSYRRKIEGDIKRIIRSDNTRQGLGQKHQNQDSSMALYERTQKLRNISLIISKLISLNKVYK
jgi:hypothetical protein